MLLASVGRMVDLTGIEPVTSSMPLMRAPNCATGPRLGMTFNCSGRAEPGSTRRGGLLVGAGQPGRQLSCCFIGRCPIKRHQCCRHTGAPRDVGTPPIARDRRNLDEVHASRNGLFEAMNDVRHVLSAKKMVWGELREFYAFARAKQAKRRTKADARATPPHPSPARTTKNIFRCQTIHRKFTVHQQVLHRLNDLCPGLTLRGARHYA